MSNGSAVAAYVLITVPGTKFEQVAKALWEEQSQFVKEVAGVYGDADMIVKLETPSVETLHKLVMDVILRLPYVQDLRTFIVIPQLYQSSSS